MDNNDFSELKTVKIDATSFNDVSKLSTAINNTITTTVSPYTYDDLTFNYPPTSYKGTINKKDLSRFMRDISLALLDAANGKDLKQVFETMSTYFAAYADAIENNTKYEENETE